MTEMEILDAIRAAMQQTATDDPSVFTIQDMRKHLQWSPPRIRDAVRQLIAAGKCEPCKAWRTDLSGRNTPVPAYRVLG